MKLSPDKNEIIAAIDELQVSWVGHLRALRLSHIPALANIGFLNIFRVGIVLCQRQDWEPDTSNVQIDDDTLLADWGKVVRLLRQIPTRIQYRNQAKFSTGTFEHRFGPWSRIPDRFRVFAANKPEWNDILALLPVQASNTTAKNQPVADVTINSGAHQSAKKNSKLRDRPIYGNHIDFRGLRHEPVNENGVIFLLALLHVSYGYSVEAVQAGVPTAKRKDK